MKLWYKTPAKDWEETLPIGNGSLGGMIFGTPEEEVVGINEETLWSGYYRDKNNPRAMEYLPKVRQLIFEKNYAEAEEVIRKHMLGEYNESYLPLGKLKISQQHTENYQNYRRELDLDTGIAGVYFTCDGVTYEREIFSSYPAKGIFCRLSSGCGKMNLEIGLESMLKISTAQGKTGEILFTGKCPEHIDPNYVMERPENIIQGTRGQEFKGSIRILQCDGNIRSEKERLHIENAGEVVLAFTAVQSGNFEGKTYEQLRQEHIEDYQALAGRSWLYLGEEPDQPTDDRLKQVQEGKEDPALYALYYQYGRYLLIASSREGSLPANLQGIWSWEMRAPWSSNWTTNINTQMNYWPVHSCNLEPCMEPFYTMMEKLCREGKKTAAIHYGCRGFVHHHNADYWGNTSPVGIIRGAEEGQEGAVTWSFWPMGGIWLTNEMYRAYEYQQDLKVLKEKIYPVLREAVLFAVDWLVPYGDFYVTCPSTSPENRFVTKEGKTSCVTMASAMDMTLIRELFENYREACGKLAIEDALLEEVKEREGKMKPFGIGKDGRLLEWADEVEEEEPGHRHVSHLYGIFPADILRRDEKLLEAGKKSLKYRLEHGGGHTGWSCAWIINLFAALGEGEKAYQYLETLLKRSTYPNLWDAHPPFQIDGNFGGIAGIANMLMQTGKDNIKVLPALPPKWTTGKITGLKGRGGLTADIEWNHESGVTVTVYSGPVPYRGTVFYRDREEKLELEANCKSELFFRF
ncbi:MAG: glycoside hydrolase family 95 protein [Clostridiales bacterium]|nr:glycoside hydrolase family 95 protein [Clostridiales bacterium]